MREAARRTKILRKTEAKLVREIAARSPEAKLAAAAEAVRAAQLSRIHAQHEIIVYEEEATQSERRHLAKTEQRLRQWREKTVADIVREYSS